MLQTQQNYSLRLYGRDRGRPPSKVQGYTVGARRDDVNTPDRLYVLLIASGASEPTTHYAEINPSGHTVTVLEQVMMIHQSNGIVVIISGIFR